MVAAKDEEKRQARELRRQGYSFGEIAKELGVSRSSVHNWCKDIKITSKQKKRLDNKQRQMGDNNKGALANKERGRKQRISYQQVGRKKAQEGNYLHCIGCMLYWAEGTKSRNSIGFANSDPEMILVFMRFLRESLQVPEEKLRMKVHCYARTEEEQTRIEQYWLDLLDLDRARMQKTQLLEGSDKALNRLRQGVCTVMVNSTEHLHHIFGAIQEYGGFEDDTWLD